MRRPRIGRLSGWYGVKSLFRIEAHGRPLGKDRLYSPRMTMIEERVVVLKARSLDNAIRLGEAEARKYARSSYRNPYGQRVRIRRLPIIEAYDINEPVRDHTEVYSSTQVTPRSVKDVTIAHRIYGRAESPRIRASRRNILDICFERPAPGVTRTRRERRFFNGISRRSKR